MTYEDDRPEILMSLSALTCLLMAIAGPNLRIIDDAITIAEAGGPMPDELRAATIDFLREMRDALS